MTGWVLEPLTTERLLLRRWRDADLDELHALQSDPDVVRYLPWGVKTREESAEWLRQRQAQDRLAQDDDAVSLAVERRADGRLLGAVNAWWRSAEHQQGEVGFMLARHAQGHGYALEAMTALLDVLFPALDLHRAYGRADARNDASIGLMRRLGMRQEAHLVENERFKGEWGDEVVCAVLRREWDARPRT